MTTSSSVVDGPIAEGATCRPNISPTGRRRRRRFGLQMLAVSVALLVVLMALHAHWYWRLLLFLPAAAAATGFLQVARDTCVLRAKEGTFEHDDFSTTPAPEDDVRASRRVARTIQRDATLIGLATAAVGVLLAVL
jgi:hypothetical protein